MNPKEIKESIIRTEISKGTKHQECFYYNQDECSHKIASAHSIQAKGSLSLLTTTIEGNENMYSFGKPLLNSYSQFVGFKPIGLKPASTFKGFCRKHDKEVFSEIEDKEFDVNDLKHCFLQSYRSFASRFVNQMSIINLYNSEKRGFSNFIKKNQTANYKKMLANIEVENLKIYKAKINKLFSTQNYHGLKYLTLKKDFVLPFATATIIKIPNLVAIQELDLLNCFSNVIISIIPKKENSIVILSVFLEDSNGVRFLDKIKNFNQPKFEKFLSLLIIDPQTYLSPIFWNQLNKEQRREILEILNSQKGVTLDGDDILSFNMFTSKHELKIK